MGLARLGSVPDLASEMAMGSCSCLEEIEQRMIDLFVDGVRVIGLPKSVGEIYGLLFVSRRPLALDDLVSRLGISKGSASQGLRTLHELGAVTEARGDHGRRTHYEPEIHLKRLVGGFLREQVVPHLDSGHTKLSRLERQIGKLEDAAEREFLNDRLGRLGGWFRRGRVVLPLLQRVIGE